MIVVDDVDRGGPESVEMLAAVAARCVGAVARGSCGPVAVSMRAYSAAIARLIAVPRSSPDGVHGVSTRTGKALSPGGLVPEPRSMTASRWAWVNGGARRRC